MSISKLTGRQIAAIVIGCYAAYAAVVAAAFVYSPIVGEIVLHSTQPWTSLF